MSQKVQKHICIICGSPLPYYGIDVCWNCEHNIMEDKDDIRIFERTKEEVSTEI